MRIIEDVKLDFKDVLITPKRSALASRSEVNLDRNFKFRSGNIWSGIPIIAANMDGVGTFEMDAELSKHKMMVALTKHYGEFDLINHFSGRLFSSVYSLGISKSDLEKFDVVYDSVAPIRVCIDVANGYTQAFVNFIKNFRV